MSKQLPMKLYVKWEQPEKDDAYLLANPKFEVLANPEAEITVGEYELKRVRTIINQTQLV